MTADVGSSPPGDGDRPQNGRPPPPPSVFGGGSRDRAERMVPGWAVLRHYRAGWLRHDLIAGLALSTILVPAGMAYAQASGLPPIVGLYATLAPLVVYAALGPSRVLVIGPDSALIPLVAASVLPLSHSSVERATAVASALAVLSGLIGMAAALLRLGVLTRLLSKPIRYGYLHGIALTVILAELPTLLGVSLPPAGDAAANAIGLADGLVLRAVDPSALAVGAGALALILALRRWSPLVPGALTAIVLAIVAVMVLHLGPHLALIGALPQGLPAPRLPRMGLSEAGQLVPAAAAIALVAFTDTSLFSRTLAVRGGYTVNPNQELFALGAANLAAGLFQGFPVSSSSSRTPVAVASGARSQLTSLIAAGIVVVVLVVAPGILASLPQTALAAVVIAAATSLFDLRGLGRLWRADRPEFVLSMAACAGVLALGVVPGVGVAVAVSLLDFVRRAWRPHDAVLGREAGLKGYHDITRHPAARQIPGLLLFRWDGPLFFANADFFRDRIQQLVADAETPVRRVIVAAQPITDVDSTAADMLQQLEGDLETCGIRLGYAGMPGEVKDQLRAYGLPRDISWGPFFPTLGKAVHQYVEDEAVPWDG